MRDIDIMEAYCKKCSLNGSEFHYLSVKLHDCVECYHALTQGMERSDLIEKYRLTRR